MSTNNNPRNIKKVTFNKVNKTNFGKSLEILSRSNFDKYVLTTRSASVLKQIDISKSGLASPDKYYYFIANLLQTLSTRGFLTYEIFEIIKGIMDNESISGENKENLQSAIKIVHTNYEKHYSEIKNHHRKILFNHHQHYFDDD